MKYIITFWIALTISVSGMAQTGLVFNQCLTFGGNQYQPMEGSASYVESSAYIVPDGKVWKIESANYSGGSYPGFLTVNGFQATLSLSGNIIHFPIWVKSGDIIRIRASALAQGEYFISILEFNAN
jgi:hypothetical protein